MRKGWAIFLLALGVAGIGYGVGRNCWLDWSIGVCLASAVGIFAGWIQSARKTPAMLPSHGDEVRLLPRRTRREQFWTFAIPLGASAIVSTGLALHRFLLTQPMPQAEQSLAVAAAISWIALAIHAIRIATAAKKMAEPRLFLSTDHPKLDQPFQVRIEVDPAHPTQRIECRVTLRCIEHVLLHLGRYTHHALRDKSEQMIPLASPTDAAVGRLFTASAEVLLDSTRHLASGKSGITMYPYYLWQIEVKLSNRTETTTIFPLTLLGDPSAIPVMRESWTEPQ